MDRNLAEVDYVYVWADGIHLNVRLEEAKACVLVLVGVRADGSKEPSRTATESSASRGPTCCVTAPARACTPHPRGR